MVVINWNVGMQVTSCTVCKLEAYVYSDRCQNNAKHKT